MQRRLPWLRSPRAGSRLSTEIPLRAPQQSLHSSKDSTWSCRVLALVGWRISVSTLKPPNKSECAGSFPRHSASITKCLTKTTPWHSSPIRRPKTSQLSRLLVWIGQSSTRLVPERCSCLTLCSLCFVLTLRCLRWVFAADRAWCGSRGQDDRLPWKRICLSLSHTPLADIANIIADAIITGRGRNQVIYTAAATYTYEEFAQLLEKVSGSTWNWVSRSRAESEAVVKGNPHAFISVFELVIGKNPPNPTCSWPVEKTYNYQQKIAMQSIEELVRKELKT